MRGQREGVGGLGGMKVNVTCVQKQRGVFDLTNRHTKTLQTPLLPTAIVLYPIKTLGAFPAVI